MKDTLAELKYISAGLTYYNTTQKQVDIRARGLPKEYTRKCKTIDQKYNGIGKDEVGPLEQQLWEFGDLKGLVVGQYGEGSQDLHDLIEQIASSKAIFMAQSSGKPLTIAERGFILSSVRRRLSVVAVRSQANCLLSRIGHLDMAAEQASQRRVKVRGAWEGETRERQAWFEAYVRGKVPHIKGNLHP